MANTRDPEQISDILTRMAKAVASGQSATEASRDCGISPATYYQWRRKYGGMTLEQLKDYLNKVTRVEELKKQIVDLSLDNAILRAVLSGLLVSSEQRRHAVQSAQRALGVSERRACAALSLPRSSHRYRPSRSKEAGPLLEALQRVRRKCPQYGYRRLAALLRAEGWQVSDIQVYRLSRRSESRSTQ